MSNPDKGGARLMKSEHKRRELAPLAAIFGILVALALAFCVIPIVEIVKFFQRKAEK